MPIRKGELYFVWNKENLLEMVLRQKKTMEDRATQPLDDMRLRFATYLL